MLEVLRATLSLANLDTWAQKDRKKLYEDIVHQQDGKIVELDDNGTEQAKTNSPEAHDGS